MEMTEREFGLLQQGDSGMFEKLYYHYEKPLYYFILAKTGGDEDATEEIFCDTIHSAFTSLTGLKNRKNIRGWLLSIASRRLADYLRKTYRRKKHTRPLLPTDQTGGDVIQDVIKAEEKAIFALALEKLAPDQLKVLTLKYREGKTVADIAAAAGVPVTTVEGQLYRAREALRRALEKLHYL